MSTPSSASLDAIHRAYVAYYGRPADYAGLQYWATVLDQSGGNLDAVIQSFGNSAESTALYGGTGSAAERIDKIYMQLFNRPAEEAGRAWWAQEIEAGRVSLPSAALAILNSALGGDRALIDQKVVAAKLFTDTLYSMGMSHSYQANDIGPARTYLSEVTTGMSDAALQAHLAETMETVQNASLLTYSSSNVLGSSLGHAQVAGFYDQTWLFGDTGRINSSTPTDIFLATLDGTMTQGVAGRLGHGDLGETLHGATSRGDGYLVWGDLDGRANQPTSNLTFLWSLNADLQPVGAVHLGTEGGTAPVIRDVTELSNGRVLVVGTQNSVSDANDAFALVLNSDLTVHAQKTFDAPELRTNESLISAHQLQDGSLILLGSRSEMFHMDQELNLLHSREVGHGFYGFNPVNLFSLENGLFLAHNGVGAFFVMNGELEVLSRFGSNNISALHEKSPGHFVAYDQHGVFFDLHIDVTDPYNPELEAGQFKQVTGRNGNGIAIHEFAGDGDAVWAIERDNIFAFSLDIPASPNLASDYRLNDLDVELTWSQVEYDHLVRPDWQISDLQIVTVGTTPAFSPEGALIQLTGVTAM